MMVVRVQNWQHVGGIRTLTGVSDRSGNQAQTCVDNTVESSKFENGWTLSIEGHDAVWADRFRVDKSSGCSGWEEWGLNNGDGWCLSTDRNDHCCGFKTRSGQCGNVPAGRCWRTFYISDNGSVYVYSDENWSLFGRRLQRLEDFSYEALLVEQNGKFYHVNTDGNAVGQEVHI